MGNKKNMVYKILGMLSAATIWCLLNANAFLGSDDTADYGVATRHIYTTYLFIIIWLIFLIKNQMDKGVLITSLCISLFSVISLGIYWIFYTPAIDYSNVLWGLHLPCFAWFCGLDPDIDASWKIGFIPGVVVSVLFTLLEIYYLLSNKRIIEDVCQNK